MYVVKDTCVLCSSVAHSLMSGASEYSIVNLKKKKNEKKKKARDPTHHQTTTSPLPVPTHHHRLPCLLSDLLQNAVLPAVQHKTPFPHGRVSKFTTLWLRQIGGFRTPHPTP